MFVGVVGIDAVQTDECAIPTHRVLVPTAGGVDQAVRPSPQGDQFGPPERPKRGTRRPASTIRPPTDGLNGCNTSISALTGWSEALGLVVAVSRRPIRKHRSDSCACAENADEPWSAAFVPSSGQQKLFR